MQHQTHTTTELDRYPDIFNFIHKSYPNLKNILSFGCSSGEECFSLVKLFPEANLYGVDINQEVLQIAKSNNNYKNIYFFNLLDDIQKVDAIFAMSVLCRWPETDQLEQNNIYKFDAFNKEICELDNKLNSGGVLILYNTSYYFADTDMANKYSIIETTLRDEFVRKFDKNGKYSTNKSPIIFVKK